MRGRLALGEHEIGGENMGKTLGSVVFVVILLVVAAGSSGCKHAVELYCDEDTPCLPRYPDRPYCDLTGDFPASEGIGRTCIPCPFEGASAEMCAPIADGGLVDADMTAPYVSSTTPDSEETGVEPTALVQVTFSKDMNPATLDESSIVITRSGTPVPGTVTYDQQTRTATFAPSSRLTLLGSLLGTVTTAAADISGIPMAADHAWTFTIRDGVWGVAEMIEADDTRDADEPQVAVDREGNAVAVWGQPQAMYESSWGNRYVADEGWGNAARLETSDSATLVTVAASPSGEAIAIWVGGGAFVNRYVPATGWGGAVPVDGGGSSQAKIAMDAVGNAMAVFSKSDGIRNNAWANRYVNGVGWAGPVLIEANDSGGAGSARVALDENGNATVVFRVTAGSLASLWANRYVSGSGWGNPELIETNDSGSVGTPELVVNGAGNAIAVWDQSDGTRNNIWANRYVAGLGWGSAVMIESSNAGTALSPHVAIDAAGNAIAVWSQSDGTRYNIWANRYVDDSGWDVPTLLENDDGGASQARIGMDSAGNALAVWSQSDGARNNMWAARYRDGAGWSLPMMIETLNLDDAKQPQVAVDPTGCAVAVWSQYDGTRDSIWANHFR